MRVHAYNPEAPRKKRADFYMGAFIGGIFIALALIVLTKGARFLFALIIEYWIWAVGILAGLILIRIFLRRRRRKRLPERYA